MCPYPKNEHIFLSERQVRPRLRMPLKDSLLSFADEFQFVRLAVSSVAQAGVSNWQLYGAPVRQFTNSQSIYKPYRVTHINFGAYLPVPILYCSASYIFGRKNGFVDIVTPDCPFARCDRAVIPNHFSKG